MTLDWKREWLPLAAIVTAFALSLWMYPRLPDPMPTHWNAAGQPDDYGSRLVGTFLLPATMVGLYALLLFLPRLDPKNANLERSWDTYLILRTASALFFLYLHGIAMVTAASRGAALNNGLIFAGMGVMLLVVGNFLPRLRPNWIAGIRTPWTLASDNVWRATHRLGGRTFMLAGLLLLCAPLFDGAQVVTVGLAIFLAAALIPILYSYLLFRREQRGGA